MRKDTYRIGDGTFAFSPAVFDSLLGHGAKGAARMRELAGAMHVSISSIKDWRRGTHAPSDFEKVEDIACWAHIDVADLLIESGDRTMDEKLTENQLDVLCVLWNQAYDFLDLCEETDHFVWPTTDLRCVPGTTTACTAWRDRPSGTSLATGSDMRPTTGRSTFPRGSTITALPPSTSFSSHSWSDAANSCANTRTRSMRSITGSSRRESR